MLALPSAQREIEALGEVDLRRTAVVSPLGTNASPSVSVRTVDPGEIALEEYRPNYLRYTCDSAEGGVAVFSEIYYDKGWTAYVDGEEAPYFRADYVLRAMELPAGRHTVEWRFRAPGWRLSEGITLAASLLILAAAVAALVRCLRPKRQPGEA